MNMNTKKKAHFRFSEFNIPFGSKLTYVCDKTVQASVVDDRHISYNGKVMSMSALAQKVKGVQYPAQGTLWFSYRGVRLSDLRKKFGK